MIVRCPLCDRRVPLVENIDIDSHGQRDDAKSYAQIGKHFSGSVYDESGRAWDVLCPQSSSASSSPMLSRVKS